MGLVIDAKSVDGEAAMHKTEGSPGGAVEVDGLIGFDGLGDEGGDERFVDVAMGFEYVLEDVVELFEDG